MSPICWLDAGKGTRNKTGFPWAGYKTGERHKSNSSESKISVDERGSNLFREPKNKTGQRENWHYQNIGGKTKTNIGTDADLT